MGCGEIVVGIEVEHGDVVIFMEELVEEDVDEEDVVDGVDDEKNTLFKRLTLAPY